MEGGRLQVPGGDGLSSDPPADFSVFDALRDTIYSEVATLIANNEARPHFLVSEYRDEVCVCVCVCVYVFESINSITSTG